jgi:glycosyltransferase involved in cell wall biosynthesis
MGRHVTDDRRVRISLVVPAYNEESFLPRLMESVEVARAKYRGGRDAVEVIISDNCSTDATAGIACSRGCKVATVEKRNIAAVRNGGVAISEGEIIASCDADMQVHPETFNVIDDFMSRGDIVGGATGFRFDRRSLALFVTSLVTVPLAKIGGFESGVVFFRREDFETVGGYKEEKLYGEDVQMLRDLRALGKQRGERFRRARGAKAIVSTRKMDKFGDWHLLWIVAKHVQVLIFAPGKIEERRKRFAGWYWYGKER